MPGIFEDERREYGGFRRGLFEVGPNSRETASKMLESGQPASISAPRHITKYRRSNDSMWSDVALYCGTHDRGVFGRRQMIIQSNAMPDCSHDSCSPNSGAATGRYRTVLWTVLTINAVMFIVEIAAGLAAGSTALQADALDFFADAANYGISLFVLGRSLSWRAGAAVIKGGSMGLLGLWVVGNVIWHGIHGTVPSWGTMGVVGVLALGANVACLALLYAWRDGDANRRSVWICSRNDVLANTAVLAAALGVFGTGTGWPDLAVAAIMALLALQGAIVIMRHAFADLSLRTTEQPSCPSCADYAPGPCPVCHA